MSIFKQTYADSESPAWYHGLSYLDPLTKQWVCYIVPVNWIARWTRKLMNVLRYPKNPYSTAQDIRIAELEIEILYHKEMNALLERQTDRLMISHSENMELLRKAALKMRHFGLMDNLAKEN